MRLRFILLPSVPSGKIPLQASAGLPRRVAEYALGSLAHRSTSVHAAAFL